MTPIFGMLQGKKWKASEGRLVLAAVAGGMAAFVIALAVISGGAVRQAEIFLPEKTYVTISLQTIDAETKVVGIGGIAGVNPTILMRIGDFAMELTITNDDGLPHSFYVDGLNASTGILEPGQSQVLTLYSETEATYSYHLDGSTEPAGEIRAMKVGIYN